MKAPTMKLRIGALISRALLCLGFALLATCGGGGGSGQTSGGTGSIAVQLHVADGQGITLAQIVCGQTPIIDVVAQVYDETNTLIASGGPWACDAHQGTISDVPAGCDRTVVVLGRDDASENVYRGQVTICVIANQNNAADVDLTPFAAPTIAQPTGDLCVSGPTVDMSWDSPWAEYALQVAAYNAGSFDFNSPDTVSIPSIPIPPVTSGDTARDYSLQGNALPHDLSSYVWRVKAADPFGNETAWSFVDPANPQALFFYSSSGC